ncbi:MAG: ribosome maturation factor RimM [Lachnospiraceae bacterium]
MDELLQVGVISSTHGVRGEVKIYPTTDDNKRFSKLKEVRLMTETGMTTLHIEHVKYFKQMVIVKFKEYQSLNEVEHIKGKPIYVTRQNAVRLEKDEYFIADLIGIRAIDEENGIEGTVTEVLRTGANDVYEIALADGRELLLPAIKDCIKKVDTKEGIMQIHVLEGLLE